MPGDCPSAGPTANHRLPGGERRREPSCSGLQDISGNAPALARILLRSRPHAGSEAMLEILEPPFPYKENRRFIVTAPESDQATAGTRPSCTFFPKKLFGQEQRQVVGLVHISVPTQLSLVQTIAQGC
jgi:hypothetical protein